MIVDLPEPSPGPDEVVVKMAAAGVCHSDLTFQVAGPGMPTPPSYPWTMGHENAGYVHALGEGVEGLTLGEPVAVWPGWGDTTCAVCRAGAEHLCPNMKYPGLGSPGGWADFLLVPQVRYLAPLGDLDPPVAAPLTDAGLTSYGAVAKTLPYLEGAGRSVAIIGAGGLGQFAIKYLSTLTDATVVAIDIEPDKREHALTIGAKHSFDSGASDAAEQIMSATSDGLGANAIIDFVGIDATLALAASVTAPQGRIVLVGIGGGSLPFGYVNPRQEVQVSTSTLGTTDDMQRVVALAREHGIVATTTQYPFEDVNQALRDLAEHKIAERGVLIL
jgi:propanol-preferring alcohol dehydrogenase